MKIASSSDWHITGKCPISRKDEYHETQCKKIEFMINYCMDNNIHGILIAGDIFDKYLMPLWVLEKYIRLFSQRGNGAFIFPMKIYVVFGQHDQPYHTSDQTNTSLGVICAACDNVQIVGPEPLLIDKNVFLYGCSWGQDIPKKAEVIATDLGGDPARHILFIHKMVVNEKLWAEQENFEYSHNFLTENDFDLIVTGDNHQTFSYTYRNRTLINNGSLMRSTSAQLEHKPCFHIWDSETRKNERIDIPIQPTSEVFDVEKLEQTKERDSKLESFVEGLAEEGYDVSMDFKSNLATFLKTADVREEVRSIIEECIGS